MHEQEGDVRQTKSTWKGKKGAKRDQEYTDVQKGNLGKARIHRSEKRELKKTNNASTYEMGAKRPQRYTDPREGEWRRRAWKGSV